MELVGFDLITRRVLEVTVALFPRGSRFRL